MLVILGIYISQVNTINSGYNINDNADFWLNYVGYQNSDTQFRDLNIANGKRNSIAIFKGSTGRVGIGTGTPQDTLDVNGNIRTSSVFNIGSRQVVSIYSWGGYNTNAWWCVKFYRYWNV